MRRPPWKRIRSPRSACCVDEPVATSICFTFPTGHSHVRIPAMVGRVRERTPARTLTIHGLPQPTSSQAMRKMHQPASTHCTTGMIGSSFAAISRDGRWLLASWKDWLAPLLIVGAVLTLNVDNFLAAVPMAVAFTAIAGVFVALLRPAVWPVTPRWAVVLTALAAGLAPMAAAVVVFLAAREWLERSQEVMALFVSAAAFFSFLACTRVMSLAETTRAQPIGEARPVPKVIRTLTQVAIGLAALALIPLHVSAFGTPWRTLASAAIVADQPIPVPSTASGYFKVSNPADHPQWYEVKGLPDEAELSVRKEQNGQHHSHVLEQTLKG